MKVPLRSWEPHAAAKRASTLAKIPPEWRLDPAQIEEAKRQRDITGPFIQRFLYPSETAIVTRDAVDLTNAVREGQLTAIQVTAAFCKTAAISHQINNCLLEIFFDQALERAQYLDEYFAEHGKTVGPLHGLPVSLKDQFHVKGVDTTMGYVGWIGSNLGITDPRDVHQVESQITSELLAAGAVLFCKTSVPQTLFFAETKNNIIGYTLNPQNRNLSCGGSSGGEGALQALGGSVLGLGTDIGGSVRIPAAFNGIFGLKPTPERLSYRNAANTNPGQNTYPSAVGLLSPTLGGLELGLRSILSTKPWTRDPAVAPIPFRQDELSAYRERADENGKARDSHTPLKLGVLWTDNTVGPHPPIIRGLHQVVNTLKAAGHKVVNWEPPSHAAARRIHLAFLKADGAHDIHSHLDLSGEPLIPDLREVLKLRQPYDLLDIQDMTIQGLEYEAAYSDYWNSTANDDGQIVDAVIMPAAPHAAVIPGKYYSTSYTSVLNLLNYSVAVIPVTKADKTVDVVDDSYEPLNEIDRKNWDAYDPEIYDGAPVGVQLVGRKFEEEKILGIAGVVMAALKTNCGV
ncbi:amidase signature domain-containing protein [Cercophora newfieldiana]|uniref:Amidase signature domain-containing protein n=1 Tax=Cercophora newfieldiana TaxID=92897 RepID=A0AA40CMD3_9PEZI|nr:amidase signature domain-containing protein [Cercophora newfieldiana]